jgi:antitoxin component of MazEF toxin-antitoxin module
MAGKTTAATKQPIGRIGQRCQVVIPLAIFETLKFQGGDFVAFAKHGNGVLVKPRRVVAAGDVLTPADSKRLRQSLKQTRQGKTKPWAEIRLELGL